MRQILILALWFFLLPELEAAKTKYPCSAIPAGLKSGAKAVVRNHDQQLIMKPGGVIEHRVVYAITILEENAERLATFYGPYDKYMKLRSVTGRIYNAAGEQEEVLRAEDIVDVSMIASYSLYQDNRVKILDPDHNQYPYTIEYTYTYVFRSFLEIPDWSIYPGYNVAVEKADFQVTTTGKDVFRYQVVNSDIEPVISSSNGGEVYRWQVENMPALIDESVSRSFRDLAPVLLIGPNSFNYGGTEGSMRSWKEFGAWIYQLGEDKRSLTDEEKAVVLGMVKGLDDDHEKTRVLYKYMQDRVRYVNISLGIGGFEPIAAERVSEVGYGDCKALSNYMRSLLDVAGIESLYTIVLAGRSHRRFIPGFPSQQFNHAILAVPFEKDTMWLECTSQRLPAGYLGSFTDDRPVLFATKEGGELSRTPKYEPAENSEIVKATCRLDSNLNAAITYSKQYYGVDFGRQLSSINNNDLEEQKRTIQNRMKLSGFEVKNFQFEVETDRKPVVTETSTISVRQIISDNGEFLPLALNILTDDLNMPSRSRNRKYPVYLKRGFQQQDSVTFLLPEKLQIHHLPEPVSLETEFGTYESTATAVEDGIVYCRRLLIYDGEYEATRFREFYGFLRKVNSADNRKALLTRQTD
ncbi:MAG: DUF3857 domain-containing protein [Bacteroidota bacterium]